jgi:hypothetical protein
VSPNGTWEREVINQIATWHYLDLIEENLTLKSYEKAVFSRTQGGEGGGVRDNFKKCQMGEGRWGLKSAPQKISSII